MRSQSGISISDKIAEEMIFNSPVIHGVEIVHVSGRVVNTLVRITSSHFHLCEIFK